MPGWYDGAGLHGFDGKLHKRFSGEVKIADLNLGRFLLGLFGEFGEARSESP